MLANRRINDGDAQRARWAAQAEWAVHPTEGDDRARGTPGEPLMRLSEWARRVRGDSLVNVPMTVDVLGTLLPDERPYGRIYVGTEGSVFIDGEPGVSELHAGSFTSAPTVCAPATNTPWSAVDSALSNDAWTAYIDNTYGSTTGTQIRIPSGDRAGNIFWPALSPSAKTVRVNNPQILAVASGSAGQSQGSIANADPYVVEQLPRLGTMRLTFDVQPNGTFVEQVVFHRLAFAGTADACVDILGGGGLAAYGCDLGASAFRGRGYAYVNCRHSGLTVLPGDLMFLGGGLSTQGMYIYPACAAIIDYRHMIQTASGNGLTSYGSNLCWLGSLQAFATGTNADGIVSRFGPGMYLAAYLGSSEIFGLSTRFGVNFGRGCVEGYDTLTGKTITGGTNPGNVGNTQFTAWNGSNLPALNQSTTAGSAHFAALLAV